MRTLCIDIGGTGLKAIVLDAAGKPVGERVRVDTPRPATPTSVLAAIADLVAPLGGFDRVSVGFPGVVVDGATHTAPNLDDGWHGFALASELATRTGKPVRAANDAGVQGLGVIEGRGVELVITLGTGMGFALFTAGHYVPNIEMAHHIFRDRVTYEDRISDAERGRIGNRRWRRRVDQIVAALAPVFNYRVLYIGGGNARRLDKASLPDNVRVVDNVAGLLGGLKLWADAAKTDADAPG